jgi:hypothetical protein
MRLAVFVDTGEADQGYEEGEEPTFEEHVDNIKELLRSGYYEVAFVDEARDGDFK